MRIDKYMMQARGVPLMALFLPVIIQLNLILVNLGVSLALTMPLANITAMVFLLVATGLIRFRGKQVEKNFFAEWGGSPAIRFLRESNKEYNLYTKNKVKRFCLLRLSGTGIKKFPTLEEENADSNEADKKYEACINELRAITRDTKKHPLVYAENINYGMWRNLYGVKLFGIIFNSTIIVANIIGFAVWSDIFSLTLFIVFVSMAAILIIFWIFNANKKQVKMTADAYARSLLETCATFSEKQIEITKR